MTKFNSKKRDIRESSAFFKHLENAHGGRIENLKVSDCFVVEIVKAYSKHITRPTEEGDSRSKHPRHLGHDSKTFLLMKNLKYIQF